jgi:hypothetical protein
MLFEVLVAVGIAGKLSRDDVYLNLFTPFLLVELKKFLQVYAVKELFAEVL